MGTSEMGARSYYGRLNYDYDEKYLLEVNHLIMMLLPASAQQPLEPFSLCFITVLTREQFMKDISWLGNLKLRL